LASPGSLKGFYLSLAVAPWQVVNKNQPSKSWYNSCWWYFLCGVMQTCWKLSTLVFELWNFRLFVAARPIVAWCFRCWSLQSHHSFYSIYQLFRWLEDSLIVLSVIVAPVCLAHMEKNVIIEFLIIFILPLRSFQKKLNFMLTGGWGLIMPLLRRGVSSGRRAPCVVWVSANASFIFIWQTLCTLSDLFSTSCAKDASLLLWIYTILASSKYC